MCKLALHFYLAQLYRFVYKLFLWLKDEYMKQITLKELNWFLPLSRRSETSDMYFTMVAYEKIYFQSYIFNQYIHLKIVILHSYILYKFQGAMRSQFSSPLKPPSRTFRRTSLTNWWRTKHCWWKLWRSTWFRWNIHLSSKKVKVAFAVVDPGWMEGWGGGGSANLLFGQFALKTPWKQNKFGFGWGCNLNPPMNVCSLFFELINVFINRQRRSCFWETLVMITCTQVCQGWTSE